MSKKSNFKVTAKECHGNHDKMIRKFIKKTKRSMIIEELRDRKEYTKPSVAKREKSARARRRKAREDQKQQRAKERRNRTNN
jgi:ribosomal protein S21|tara:strand:+ start:1078 stop:1323 length:246 start_codon:yes stop_codon:yes gene_type:complete